MNYKDIQNLKQNFNDVLKKEMNNFSFTNKNCYQCIILN